jgi:TPR repeat protein
MKKQTVFALALLLIDGCANQQVSRVEKGSGNADQLLIVDCLLPGEVRNLGHMATYITARKAIKATALECADQGGEYAAPNQANYLTALAAWLPRAEAGDAESQAYVGEAYEKGLGIAPDYDKALFWYRKAADQGNSRALINLGYLYEKGLGVKADPNQAIAFYQQSSPLIQTGLNYATTMASDDGGPSNEDIRFLKTELSNSRRQIQQLSEALDASRLSMEQQQSQLSDTELSLQATRQQLQTATHEKNTQAIDQFEQQLAQKQQALDEQMDQLAKLNVDYAEQLQTWQQAVKDAQRRSEQLAAELEINKTEQRQDQARLVEIQNKLSATTERLLAVNQQYQETKQNSVPIHQFNEQTDIIDQLKQEREQLQQKLLQFEKRVEQQTVSVKPRIEILDPAIVLVRGTPVVKLRSKVQYRDITGRVNTPTQLLSLVVNDKTVHSDHTGLFHAQVDIAQTETPVEIVAIDQSGSKAKLDFVFLDHSYQNPATVTLTETVDTNPFESTWKSMNFGRYYALVIGNNDYQKVPDLKTPVNDAEAVAEVLKTRYGFETQVLVNATRYQILSELNRLRGELNETDNLLVYYAGHGELDRINMRGHWLPVDADPDNSANWISTVAITDILNSMSVKHIMVVSDSCYSGAMTRSSLARLESGISAQKKSEWLKAMLKAKSRTVLTSGGLKPVMDGGGGDHSVFARAFLKALATNNQLLEGQSLYRQVSGHIIALAAEYGIEQVPEYAPIRHAGHESGEFFFVPSQPRPRS